MGLIACEDDGIKGFEAPDITKSGDFWNVPYDTSGVASGHTYVDLGLSVMWSTCNIDATHPLMPGSYFAWGETSPKDSYVWENYKYRDEQSLLTKYNFDKTMGKKEFVDSIYTLLPEDDAAVQNWGNGWRIPTKKEIDELRNQCEWVWINDVNANYHKVIGPNGNYIMLPACGSIKDRMRIMYMENGCLWSSSLSVNIATHAYELTQYATGYWTGSADRFYGEPIRPVIDPKNIKH